MVTPPFNNVFFFFFFRDTPRIPTSCTVNTLSTRYERAKNVPFCQFLTSPHLICIAIGEDAMKIMSIL